MLTNKHLPSNFIFQHLKNIVFVIFVDIKNVCITLWNIYKKYQLHIHTTDINIQFLNYILI